MTQIEDLRLALIEAENKIWLRAVNEMIYMLQKMGVAENEFFDLHKSKEIVSIKYYKKPEDYLYLIPGDYTIGYRYRSRFNTVNGIDCSINYDEVIRAADAVDLHYQLRANFNRFQKEKKHQSLNK